MVAKFTTVLLHVVTGDSVAEVFIIDSHFQRVDQGVGEQLTFSLPRGLYAVKVRVGSETEEKPVILSQEETLIFTPLPFASSAPLWGTRTINSAHIAQAEEQSRHVHLRLGYGSQLFIFVRDLGNTRVDEISTEDMHPAIGLSLQDECDQQLVDFSDRLFPYQIGRNGWSACNVEVNPGSYRICLRQTTDEVIEQTIVTSPGWQTQLFLSLKDYGIADKRPDLVNGSIFMTEIGAGFHSSAIIGKNYRNDEFRLTEMIRLGLINDRQVVSNRFINQLLDGQFVNPMLGLYSAHLLLIAEPFSQITLWRLITTLRKLIGNRHPDVETLAVKLGLETDFTFNLPPMLRQSWSLLLSSTISKPELIAENALICQVTNRFLAGAPWLLWLGLPKDQDRYEVGYRQLQTLLDSFGHHEEINKKIDFFIDYLKENQVDIRNEKATDLTLIDLTKSLFNNVETLPSISDEEVTQLVFGLGVPRSKVNSLLNEYSTYLFYSKLKHFTIHDLDAFEKLYHWFRIYYLPFNTGKESLNQLKTHLCIWLEGENFFGNHPYALLLYTELATGIRPPLAGFLKLICEPVKAPNIQEREFSDYRRKSLAHWFSITNQNAHFIDLPEDGERSSFYENMSWRPVGYSMGKAIDIVTSPQDLTLTTHFNKNSLLGIGQNAAWATNEIQTSQENLEVYEELLVILSIATNDERATRLQHYGPELFNKYQEMQQ